MENQEDRYAKLDEKKRKRMISNRESARRSRQKKDQHVKDLMDQIAVLKSSSFEIARKIDELERRFAAVDSENRVLMAQEEELKKRLESAEMIASYVAGGAGEFDDGGYLMGGAPVQDPWMLQWQQPPIMTSAGLFQF